MRICLLGSGSQGNVAFVEGGNTRVLVDAGLNKATIVERLAFVSKTLTLTDLHAMLVTHNHKDHAGCATKLGLPVYATQGTIRTCEFDQQTNVPVTRVLAGENFSVGELDITPVLLPHDAVETVGYVLRHGRSQIGILTDCGYDADEVAVKYAGCDVLVLETNHDEALLKHGPYPSSLKRRVGGRRGHLSNDQSASLLRMMLAYGPPPKLVIAAHLSLANNRPQLAKSALDRVLGRAGRVIVASQERGTPVIALEGGRVKILPPRNQQLQFEFALAGAPVTQGSLSS